MRKLAFVPIFILLFLSLGIVYGGIEVTKAANESQSKDDGLTELQYYKQMYENAEKVNNQLVSAIYGTLGVTAALVALLFGSSIFFNYRIARKEVKDIKNSLENDMRKMESDVVKTNEGKFDEFKRITGKELKEENKTYQQRIDKEVDGLKKSMNSKLEKANNDINNNITQLQNEIKRIEERNEKELIEVMNEVKKEFYTFIMLFLPNNDINLIALGAFIKNAELDLETRGVGSMEVNLVTILGEMRELTYLPNIHRSSLAELLKMMPDKTDSILNEKSIKEQMIDLINKLPEKKVS